MSIEELLNKAGLEREKREYIDEDLSGINILKIERKSPKKEAPKTMEEKDINRLLSNP